MTPSEELLKLVALSVRSMSGFGGTQLLGVGAQTGSWSAVSVARAGTTITLLTAVNKIDPTVTLSLTFFNPDTVALEKGDLFVAPEGYRITAVTVGAGAVQAAQ